MVTVLRKEPCRTQLPRLPSSTFPTLGCLFLTIQFKFHLPDAATELLFYEAEGQSGISCNS